ncbi:MAG: glycosyltransferase family 2 protein [Aureispira sp.]|nr:glycosyltransferase family 2 protein [Aureispira sp.]
MQLSVISPVYRAEKIVEELVRQIIAAVEPLDLKFEIILVEDGGPDNSWQQIELACQKDKRVKGIKLSRNFGQHYAITAGLEASLGEWVVVMDCDLQDRPDEIPKLYQKAQEGYEIVVAQRLSRKDSFIKRMTSKLFYAIFSYLTDTPQDSSVANFGVYHRKVIDAVISMKDRVRAFPMLVQWVGFDKHELAVVHSERASGKSSYTFLTLLSLAFNVIISFSQKPLRLTLQLGLFISGVAILVGVYYLYLFLTGNITVPGYASIILSIWFLSGIIISTMGMIGLYLGRVYDQVKGRPLYIIQEKRNTDEQE